MRTIIKGSSITIFSIIYLDQAKTLIANLTGATITNIVKRRADDLDANAIFTKSVGSGITITDAVNGKCSIVWSAANTNSLIEKKIYYETIVKLSDGTIIRNGVNEIAVSGNVLKILP